MRLKKLQNLPIQYQTNQEANAAKAQCLQSMRTHTNFLLKIMNRRVPEETQLFNNHTEN